MLRTEEINDAASDYEFFASLHFHTMTDRMPVTGETDKRFEPRISSNFASTRSLARSTSARADDFDEKFVWSWKNMAFRMGKRYECHA